jgi:hypothetical protein
MRKGHVEEAGRGSLQDLHGSEGMSRGQHVGPADLANSAADHGVRFERMKRRDVCQKPQLS